MNFSYHTANVAYVYPMPVDANSVHTKDHIGYTLLIKVMCNFLPVVCYVSKFTSFKYVWQQNHMFNILEKSHGKMWAVVDANPPEETGRLKVDSFLANNLTQWWHVYHKPINNTSGAAVQFDRCILKRVSDRVLLGS